MATVLLALVLTICACSSPVGALRCYCTTSKGAAECDNNVCEIHDTPGDSGARPACAALNHSVTGIHYACVRSKLEVDETTCKVGPTKNSGTVTACWCRDTDYCNERLFDRTLMESESSSDDADDSSAEHTDHSPIEHAHHSPIEQHEQPVSEPDDIHITAAKIDEMGEVDDSETQSGKTDYYDDDDDDEEEGDVAVGSEDEDNKEEVAYYENVADPFVEHTSEHTTTTKKKPIFFETTAAPTYYPRMFTEKKLTTTLYWRPSIPTTTTPATTTTETTATTVRTTTTTIRSTTARVTSSPPRKAPAVDDSESGKMPKGVPSDNDEKRIKAQYPSNVMITQSVPRAVYGALSTTAEPPTSIVGDGVDSRAKNHRSGYGSGVNSRMDADRSGEAVEDNSDKTAERTGGGRVYLNASSRMLGSECLFALALVLSVLPVLL